MPLRNALRAVPVTRGRLAVAVLTGVLLLVAGVLLLPSSSQPDIGAVPPSSPRANVESPAPSAVTKPSAPTATRTPAAATKTPAPAADQPFAPLTVQVPRVGIGARVVPVGIGRDGMLVVPEDVRQVGWWRGGAAAGAGSGTVVLVGHVDSARQGAGAFFPLRQLKPGDRVVLSGPGGERTAYVVAARRQYPKAALPLTEVFGQGSTPRLVLLTCGGRFESATGHYEDNVVVYATPRT